MRRRIKVRPDFSEVRDLVAQLNIGSNERCLFELAVEDYNSRVDFDLSAQGGYFESTFDYFTNGEFQNSFIPSVSEDFDEYADSKLGDVHVETRLWPNRSATLEYTFKAVYNIGDKTDELVVELELNFNAPHQLANAWLLYDDSQEDSKYLTAWLLAS
jgi:hypothetical protein